MSTATSETVPDPNDRRRRWLVPHQWGNPSKNGRPKRHFVGADGDALCNQSFDGELLCAAEARERSDGICRNCLREAEDRLTDRELAAARAEYRDRAADALLDGDTDTARTLRRHAHQIDRELRGEQ